MSTFDQIAARYLAILVRRAMMSRVERVNG